MTETAGSLVKVTYYVEVLSSWCNLAEPAWDEAKSQFPDEVSFDWAIALMNPDGVPVSRDQADWFYRRSAHIAQSGYVMNSGWFEVTRAGIYLAPNLVAEAARTLGATGDNVRRALTAGALRDGHRIGEMDISVAIASSVSGIDPERLRERATDPTTEARVRASTDAFHATGATQRPTFVVTSKIGDLAVMSGFYRSAALTGAITAMLSDARAYRDYGAVHGDPPAE